MKHVRPPCVWQAGVQAERLAQRLQAVCGWEGLQADKSALRGLVERTDCDIRACLNTLQVRYAGGNLYRVASRVPTRTEPQNEAHRAVSPLQPNINR